MSTSPGLGRFAVSLLWWSLLWKHPVSAGGMLRVSSRVLPAAPVAEGQGLTRADGERVMSLIREWLLDGESLLRFLLFQQLLFLLWQVETIVFPMENPILGIILG